MGMNAERPGAGGGTSVEISRGWRVKMTAAICTRGRTAQVGRALKSLLESSARPAEILIVDNAPNDDSTRRLVGRFADARYVLEPTPGLDYARNRALAEAQHPIVGFLDDDAVADSGWGSAIAKVFEGDAKVGACTGRVEALSLETPAQRLFEANGGYSRGAEPIRLPLEANRRLHGLKAPLIAWAVSIGNGCGLAVRRDLVLTLGGFDEALDCGDALPGGGDLDMLWRMIDAGYQVAYEPAALAWHEHRREMEELTIQLAGHQRALVAFLTKTAAQARGRSRFSVLAFLGWRLIKPGARLARRLFGRDPLPARILFAMWRDAWRGPAAYRSARRREQRRTTLLIGAGAGGSS